MKRKLILMSMLLSFVLCAQAQYVTSGRVLDQHGNPISGATVLGKGTSRSVTTGIDGSFSLESNIPVKRLEVSYMGKQSKSQSVSKRNAYTIVTLKERNEWWPVKPDGYHWFANLQVGLLSKHSKDVPIGVMGGMVKYIGFFAKVMYTGLPSTETGAGAGYTGNYKTGYFSAVAGPVVRLFSPIHLYAGVGYVNRKIAYEASDNKYYKINYGTNYKFSNTYSHYMDGECSYSGLQLEGGLLINIKHIVVNGGISFGGHELGDRSVHFGVGYMF